MQGLTVWDGCSDTQIRVSGSTIKLTVQGLVYDNHIKEP